MPRPPEPTVWTSPRRPCHRRSLPAAGSAACKLQPAAPALDDVARVLLAPLDRRLLPVEQALHDVDRPVLAQVDLLAAVRLARHTSSSNSIIRDLSPARRRALTARGRRITPASPAAGTQSSRPMDLGLKGKRAIVTGGSKGIGRRCADIFADEGANVAICARNQAEVDGHGGGARAKGVTALRRGARRRRQGGARGLGGRCGDGAGRHRHRRRQCQRAGHGRHRGGLAARSSRST